MCFDVRIKEVPAGSGKPAIKLYWGKPPRTS